LRRSGGERPGIFHFEFYILHILHFAFPLLDHGPDLALAVFAVEIPAQKKTLSPTPGDKCPSKDRGEG
jgi:hypothetical protein